LIGELARLGAPDFIALLIPCLAGLVAIFGARGASIDTVQRRAIPLAILASPLGWGAYVILFVPSMLSAPRWNHTLTAGALLPLIPLQALLWLNLSPPIAGTIGTIALAATAVGLWRTHSDLAESDRHSSTSACVQPVPQGTSP
jgi:hypothetical protein